VCVNNSWVFILVNVCLVMFLRRVYAANSTTKNVTTKAKAYLSKKCPFFLSLFLCSQPDPHPSALSKWALYQIERGLSGWCSALFVWICLWWMKYAHTHTHTHSCIQTLPLRWRALNVLPQMIRPERLPGGLQHVNNTSNDFHSFCSGRSETPTQCVHLLKFLNKHR